MTKIEAMLDCDLIAPAFRVVCEALEIDADQSWFTGQEVARIKEHIKERSNKQKDSQNKVDGYTARQCSELLGVSAANFSTNYAKKVKKISRGFYEKESVDQLVSKLKGDVKKEDMYLIVDPKSKASSKRVQRVSVGEDVSGNAVISIYLEGVSPKDVLNELLALF